MGKLDLDTTQMAESAKQLKRKANEMETAVKAADTSFSPCKSMTSKRVKKRADEWAAIQEKFKKMLDEMVQASDKLLKAAQGFEGEDEKD